jgi:two-component system KDP operon response regulator KdpE
VHNDRRTSPRPSAPLRPTATARSSARNGGHGGTALVVADTELAAVAASRALAPIGWKCVCTTDLDRASWLVAVRNFGILFVAGTSDPWTIGSVSLLRPLSRAPMVALSSHVTQSEPTLLNAGADLVLEHGYSGDLLRAGTDALLRRAIPNRAELRFLESPGLRVDLLARSVTVDDHQASLTPTEFDLLRLLMSQPFVAIRHHDILKEVWDWKYADDRNALRLQINRLRKKLEASGERRYIRAARGIGYSFDQPVTELAGQQEKGSRAENDNYMATWEGHLSRLIESLFATHGRLEACRHLVDLAVGDSLCDGASVFARRTGSNVLDLVAQAGMSQEWQTSVATGVPLDGGYVSADTFNARAIRRVVDITKLKRRYPATAQLTRSAEAPSILSVPLADTYGTWGQLGFIRRSDSPFTPLQCMVLEAAGAVLGGLFPCQLGQPGSSLAAI